MDDLSTADLAAMFHVDTRTIQRWENVGRIPRATRTLGGHRRWRRSDIERILKEGSSGQADEDTAR